MIRLKNLSVIFILTKYFIGVNTPNTILLKKLQYELKKNNLFGSKSLIYLIIFYRIVLCCLLILKSNIKYELRNILIICNIKELKV